MTQTKLTLRRDAYLTNGKDLFRVTRIQGGEVWVEDALTLLERTLSHDEIATGDWRTVEKTHRA